MESEKTGYWLLNGVVDAIESFINGWLHLGRVRLWEDVEMLLG